MKHLMCRILFLYLLLTLSDVCNGQKQPTKQETVSWLKSRLDYNRQWKEQTYEKLELAGYDFQNDTLYYKVQYVNRAPEGGYRLEAIPLRDINPARVRVVRLFGDEGDLGIELYTNNGNKVIRQFLKGSSKYPGVHLEKDKIQFYIPKAKIDSEGEDLPYRIENAVKFLIKLVGGKGESF